MYADKMTDAMENTIGETNRRRAKQVAYNTAHGIEPVSIIKAVHDLTERLTQSAAVAESKAEYKAGSSVSGIPQKELKRVIIEIEKQMKESAKNLEFEQAAVLRDQLYELRNLLADESNLPPWQRARLLSGEEE
jgi:excinuclease ABC subunit B